MYPIILVIGKDNDIKNMYFLLALTDIRGNIKSLQVQRLRIPLKIHQRGLTHTNTHTHTHTHTYEICSKKIKKW